VDETLKKWKESLKPIVENAAKGDAPKKDEETDADGGQGQG
jgi:hypothetical protein